MKYTRSTARASVALATVIAVLGGCSVCTGCGSASSESAAQRSSTSSGGASTSVDATSETTTRSVTGTDSAPSVSSGTASGSPARPETTTRTDATTAGGVAQPMLSRDDQIAQWSERLAAAELQFQASPGVCRDVCRATQSICVASRELCALTGDRAGAPPTDPRCARARSSCDRATRQRDESCQSCPTE